jgi:CheY-like chemotaxis protein
VPPLVAGRIFEPFYTTKGVGEGTGLGLSIALGIAQAHGGTLELLATRPEGACFRMTLPIVVGTAGAGTSGATWSAIHGRRALVADDEPALRKLLHRLLTRRGFAVDVAEDGLQASRLIEVNRYDVLLCDVQMPRMTGPQLYESLRRTQPQLAPAFVLISGDIPQGPLQALLAASRIPLLSKPFGAKNLDLVLGQVLARRTAPPDPPAPDAADVEAS